MLDFPCVYYSHSTFLSDITACALWILIGQIYTCKHF